MEEWGAHLIMTMKIYKGKWEDGGDCNCVVRDYFTILVIFHPNRMALYSGQKSGLNPALFLNRR